MESRALRSDLRTILTFVLALCFLFLMRTSFSSVKSDVGTAISYERDDGRRSGSSGGLAQKGITDRISQKVQLSSDFLASNLLQVPMLDVLLSTSTYVRCNFFQLFPHYYTSNDVQYVPW